MSKCSIIFDLDGVLCWSINDNPEELLKFKKLHPEYPINYV